MANLNISSAAVVENTQEDFAVMSQAPDNPGEAKENRWWNDKFIKYFGNYKTIPEFAAVTDAKATWTVGKGFTADKLTTFILQSFRGNGFDTFNTILENCIRTYHIGGDSYCEIIRHKNGTPINLKPLDPNVMVHVSNSAGRLIAFEQMSTIKGKKKKRFTRDKIFYLPRNRVANEVHGNTMSERLMEIILMRNEAMADWKRVMHRNVDPMWIVHLDTDDPAKIAEIETKWAATRKNADVLMVPKDIVVPELVSTASNATLNPLPWIASLNDYFYQSAGVPQIVLGGVGAITEAAVKIAYLAFQQTIEEEQLFIEEQVGLQLGFKINLEFPASLENELLSDKKKDRTQGATQKNDTTAGIGK